MASHVDVCNVDNSCVNDKDSGLDKDQMSKMFDNVEDHLNC